MHNVDNFQGYQIFLEFNKRDNDLIFVAKDEYQASEIYDFLRFFEPENCYLMPNLDNSCYSKLSSSQKILTIRASTLGALATNSSKKILIISAENFYRRLPLKEFFINNAIKLYPGLDLSPNVLAQSLVQNGFYRTASVNAFAEFAWRGDIIDICILEDKAYRIYFDWDKVVKIKALDISDQRSTIEILQLAVYPLAEFVLNASALKCFDTKFQNSTLVLNDQFHYSCIIKGRKFPGIEDLWPMFFNETNNICDFLNNPLIFTDLDIRSFCHQLHQKMQDKYHSCIQHTVLICKPEELFLVNSEVENFTTKNLKALHQESFKENFYLQAGQEVSGAIELACKFFIDNVKRIKIVLVFSSDENIPNIKAYLEQKNLKYQQIDYYSQAQKNYINIYIGSVKAICLPDCLIIDQGSIFGLIKARANQLKAAVFQNFLLELNNFQPGEIVVHKDYGIGKFLGVQALDVENIVHDYVKLLYANDDKVYIPVENIELIKKFGQGNPDLDKLGISSWQKRKASLKNRISEIATKLISTAASRLIADGMPINVDMEKYQKFCKLFPYIETHDQEKAINDVYQDLTTGKLMDRLVCGDVGYGKTEVAMRASFLVWSFGQAKQVAILAPTTVLARQHFITFKERFESFGARITQLSRFARPKEQKIAKEQIKSGQIDIVIGTQSLFSNNLEFCDLGLIIIDEEHQFGVKDKEKLKNLKKSAHILSLSATPIPRTLQMSLVGIRDLSIIASPPFQRIPIKTFLLESYDTQGIKDAIYREISRNGQIFYVAPRLQDLDDILKELQEMDSSLRIQIAHGQMPIDQLDKVLSDFYDGKFDILLSTNIVQSGLDIPNANTIIIHNAHMLGLSQLYQLKGRVGRKDIQGYCYLISKLEQIGSLSYRRLQIIQSVKDLGAGFNIASFDIDLRGYGNLLGDEQSGHVKEVGIELYQEMLQEEITRLKNIHKSSFEQDGSNHDEYAPVINLGMPIYIPSSYINDENLKLLTYRRVARIATLQECCDLMTELRDRFGPIPKEVENLLDTIKLKNICKTIKVSRLDLGSKGLVLRFHNNTHLEKMSQFVNKFPKHSKIRGDGSLVIIKQIPHLHKITETTKILQTLDKFIHD
jgi:transcription-repair coupling factor (superfamily II helicase)